MRKIVNISMPGSLYGWVTEREKHRRYGSVSEYVRDLIREDVKRVEAKQEEQMDREARYHRDVLSPHYNR